MIIVARRQDVLDAAAADEIRTASPRARYCRCRQMCTDKETRQPSVVNTAVEKYGRVDILVNNAGTSMAKGFEDVSDDDWEFDFELKVWGAVQTDPGLHSGNAESRRWTDHQRDQFGRSYTRAPIPCPLRSPERQASPSPRDLSKDLASATTSWSTRCVLD